mmetsp:Transcript_32687/g.91808  ORF Transcript_32687/g.91808 Transcript_32687/m.91808 type:complete len:230 (-) Transcript_32687:2662-3351(-)
MWMESGTSCCRNPAGLGPGPAAAGAVPWYLYMTVQDGDMSSKIPSSLSSGGHTAVGWKVSCGSGNLLVTMQQPCARSCWKRGTSGVYLDSFRTKMKARFTCLSSSARRSSASISRVTILSSSLWSLFCLRALMQSRGFTSIPMHAQDVFSTILRSVSPSPQPMSSRTVSGVIPPKAISLSVAQLLVRTKCPKETRSECAASYARTRSMKASSKDEMSSNTSPVSAFLYR